MGEATTVDVAGAVTIAAAEAGAAVCARADAKSMSPAMKHEGKSSARMAIESLG
jgi:hypothetical protein